MSRGRDGTHQSLGPPNLYRPKAVAGVALGCICGKHMLRFANGGTCLWCGHGTAYKPVELAYDKATKLNTSAPMDVRAAPLAPIRKRAATWDEDRCVEAYWRWKDAMGRCPHTGDWTLAQAPGEPQRPSYGTIRKLFGGWPGFLHYIAEVPREQVAA